MIELRDIIDIDAPVERVYECLVQSLQNIESYRAWHREHERALLHGSGLSPGSPFPERESPHSIAVGHAETGHRVENAARELYLHLLAR
jgi:hypothetical protein